MYSTMKLSNSCETAVEPVARSHIQRSPVSGADAMEHRHVDELADQERHDRARDGPHALAEDQRIGPLDVRHAERGIRIHPERRRRQRDGDVGRRGRPRR